MSNPKCPECKAKTVCEGFYGMEVIVYKCTGKGCRKRVYQDRQGYYTKKGNTRHNLPTLEIMANSDVT